MKDYKFKNLAAVALERRWKNLSNQGDWDSILQLTTERLNHLYEDFKENQHELLDSIKEGKKGLKQEEASNVTPFPDKKSFNNNDIY